MIKAVFYFALIGGIIYGGILFGLPYYNYMVFKSDLDEMAKIDIAFNMTDEKFNQKILQQAKDANVPITEKNIKIYRDSDNPRNRDVIVSWSVTVDLFGFYQHTYHFQIDTR